MLDIVKFSALNAKLKGMYAKSLKKEEYEEIIKQNSIKDILLMLKSKFNNLEILSDNANRIQIEELLYSSLLIDIQKINRLLDVRSKEILNYYLRKYEISYIKEELTNLLYKDIKVKQKTINTIFPNIKNISIYENILQFIDSLKNTPYYKIVAQYIVDNIDIENVSIFKIENDLDKLYFEELYEIIKHNKEKHLKDIVGKQIDLFNIIWIERAKRYHNFSEQQIKNSIIKIFYKLTPKQINELIIQNEYVNILNDTIYKNVFSNNNMEEDMQKYIHNTYITNFKTDLFDFSTVISYLELKEREIKNIINIIEGVRYGLTKEEIEEKIIS